MINDTFIDIVDGKAVSKSELIGSIPEFDTILMDLYRYRASQLETIIIDEKDYSLSTVDYVRVFHETFGHPVEDKPNIKDQKLNDLRVSLLSEELDELKEALNNQDEVKALDALTDLQVVLDGAYLALGFYKLKNAAFLDVHNSNMSKLGEDGKPIYREDGKIMKGPNYKAPELGKLLN